MPYSTSNPPVLLVEGTGGFMRIWGYRSVDAAALIQITDYITNGDDLGMQAGDWVFAVDTDATPPGMTIHGVASVTAGGAADLTDGIAAAPGDTD